MRTRGLGLLLALLGGCFSIASFGQTATETILANFSNTNGGFPNGGVVQAADGNFYGVTETGGTVADCAYETYAGCGTIYKLTPTGTLTTIYKFTGGATGAYPYGSLIVGPDGNLYGVTLYGGDVAACPADASEGIYVGGCGTVFKVTTAGAITTLHAFCSETDCEDGGEPLTGLTLSSDGDLYGTNELGIFKITTSGTYTLLYDQFFLGSQANAAYVLGPMVEGSDGTLYGTSELGGMGTADGLCGGYCGTLFSISRTSPYAFNILYSFGSLDNGEQGEPIASDGAYPYDGLVEGSDGNFYGTTLAGGDNSCGYTSNPFCGIVFKMTSSGTETVLFSFDGLTGVGPGAGLFLASDGNYYGTTSSGGNLSQCDSDSNGQINDGCGTVFKITPSGTFTQLYEFTDTNSDSEIPVAGLVQGSDGNFYGTAYNGGTGKYGTVYRIGLSTQVVAPVQMKMSVSDVALGSSATLSWSVSNAFSNTMQQCYAFVQGGVTGAGTWTGKQTGKLSGGLFSGSATIEPTADGTYTYALVCGGQETGFATLTAGTETAVKVTTAALPDASKGQAYSQTLTATGGKAPYTWSLSSGSLPAGLTLSSAGVISGTPTATGTDDFVVKVTDSSSPAETATASLGITVVVSLPVITTTSLPGGVVGTAYSATLAVSGGTSPYKWSLLSGDSLPAGLTLNATTGVISGTPTTAETENFTVEVTDNAGHTAEAALSIFINFKLSITTTGLANGAWGASYSDTLTAQGGVTPYTWSISSGSLPPGLTLTASTGVIAGTPTKVGTYSFTVKVTDSTSHTATANFSIVVGVIPLEITSNFPAAEVGIAFSSTATASGGITPYTWSITSGSLPAGLTLNASSGLVSGTPTSAQGEVQFHLTVTDSESPPASTYEDTVINVYGAVKITPTTLPNGVVGTAYSEYLATSGGVGPLTWSITSGSLPAGLTFNATSALISGTPTTTGTSNFTIKVVDSLGGTNTAALSIVVTETAPLKVATTRLEDADVADYYSYVLEATGGTPPYTWSLASGSWPTGISFSSAGLISGVPSTAGTYSVTVEVTDSLKATATEAYSFVVKATPLQFTIAGLPNGTVGTPYSQTAAVIGGTPPYTWTLEGTLPAGLTLNTSTGVISGTPTATQSSTVDVKVADSGGLVNTLTSTPMFYAASTLHVTTVQLPSAAETVAYSWTMTATGGTAPYTWSTNNLPAGLTLNASTGVISGTPTVTETTDQAITVTDSKNNTATVNLPFVSNASTSVRVGTKTLAGGTVGTAYSETVAASGGSSPFFWTLVSGSLPNGLSLALDTGVISGTPTTAGTATFFVQILGKSGNTAIAELSITVAQ